MAIIVKEYSPEVQRIAKPEQPIMYQFYEVEKKFDTEGIERGILVERERRTLHDLENEKAQLQVRMDRIDECIATINALK